MNEELGETMQTGASEEQTVQGGYKEAGGEGGSSWNDAVTPDT